METTGTDTLTIIIAIIMILCTIITTFCAVSISSNTRKAKDYLWKIAYKDDLKKD